MSDTAQAWVWEHSRARGVPRLVLLALAYEAAEDGTVRMGTAELIRLTRASRAGVLDALAALVDAGELEVVTPGAGKRATVYRLPGATASGLVSRPLETRSGLVSRPLDRSRSGEQTASVLRSGEQTTNEPVGGLVSRPLELDLTDGAEGATRARASSKAFNYRGIEGGRERAPEQPAVVPGGIPEWARPLVDRITASGVIVRWNLGAGEWLTLDAMIKRSGVDMLAAAAVRAAARADVGHARYFLAAWRSLPPAPADGTTPAGGPRGAGPNVLPFDTAQPRRSRAQRTADELAQILAREAAQQ